MNSKFRIKKEVSAGGIVYRKLKIENACLSTQQGKLKIEWLICQHSQHKGWVFPKGLIGDKNKNESLEKAALRETEEETGIKAVIIIKDPIKVEYIFRHQNLLINKTVYYFLMEYQSGDIKNHDWEMQDVKFVSEQEVKKTLTFQSDQEAFNKVLLVCKNFI